jgi:hypothetical protein
VRNRIALAFALFLGLAVSALGQTPAPAPQTIQHFVINANAAGYGGSQAVSIEGAGFQVTSNVSVAYGRISNPTDSQQPIYNLGDLNYTRELRALLGSKLSSKLVFDTTNWLVTFQVSGGKVTAPGGINRIAEGAGIYCTRPVANNMSMTTGIRFLHGIGNTTVKVPVAGVNFTF